MIIKNYEHLALTPARKQALRILEAGLQAIDTEILMKERFVYDAKADCLYINRKQYDLREFDKVVVVGAGKMAALAAQGIERVMKDRLTGGLVIDIVPMDLEKIVCRVGTHPLPSGANVTATNEIIRTLENLTERDLLITIIGGGGSSLLTSPQVVTIEEERKITRALMDAGADIGEMNTVRKHLSQIKGGGLAKLAYPARIISLIFSDVPGDDISMVASGPTVKDSSTMGDAMSIMDRYRILDRCSIDHCGFVETPKEDKYFKRVDNILMCSSKLALEAMRNKAHDLGLHVKVWNRAFTGEARDVAAKILADIRPNECLIAAGESVVTIKSTEHGTGGRNQEMSLAALSVLPENTVFAALASDGRDNSDVAGGIVDSITQDKVKEIGADLKRALALHDEYSLILDLNAAIMTGVTGSNISDLLICIRE